MRIQMLGMLLGMAMMVSSFAGCGKGGEASAEKEPQRTQKDQVEDTEQKEAAGEIVGLSMPTQTSERWIKDAAAMKQLLEEKGYEVKVQFAENDPGLQGEQIRQLMEDGANCLVVTAVESDSLTEVLTEAKNQKIPVIAYDRLLRDTDAVSYYAAFDSQGIGRQIGTYIVENEELEALKRSGESRTIEFFMGSPKDDNGLFLYAGVMDVLQPYLESGTLECLSGKTAFGDTCIEQWSKEKAKERCQDMLQEFYQEKDLDIVCTAFDGFAYGVREALEESGYGLDAGSKEWPLITGQDAELMAVKNIITGCQAMSVYKDTSLLAEACTALVESCLTGKSPKLENRTEHDNGVKVVETYLCKTEMVNQDNYGEVLVESGYYSEDDLK